MTFESEWERAYGVDRDPVRQLLIYPMLARLAGSLDGKTLLDLGCGNGSLILHLLGADWAAAQGVDRSESFIAQARAHILDGRVSFDVQDVTSGRLPCGDGTIDVAFSVFVFNELPAIDHVAAELARVLAPGGTYLVVTTHPFVPLNYYLYEKFTGLKNPKITPARGYFDRYEAEYTFTIARTPAPFVHHTLQDIVNTLSDAGLSVRKLHELTVTPELMARVPEYAGGNDIPRYLLIEGEKDPRPQ